MSTGNCLKCEFYSKDGNCKMAENSLATMTDVRCLLKNAVILLRDIAINLNEEIEEDE